MKNKVDPGRIKISSRKLYFASSLKPGLHMSCKNRKHMFGNMHFSCPHMAWSPYLSNDHKYSIDLSQEIFVIDVFESFEIF